MKVGFSLGGISWNYGLISRYLMMSWLVYSCRICIFFLFRVSSCSLRTYVYTP